MNVSQINIYSNHNTPSFGLSEKISKKAANNGIKAVKAAVAAGVSIIGATAGKNLINDSFEKNNVSERSVNIDDAELYIDNDGYLTKTKSNERVNGYYILSESNSLIFKLPNGTLMSPDGVSEKPALAIDVLKDEIKKVHNENFSAETEIKKLDKYIEDTSAYTDKKGADLKQIWKELKSYEEMLKNFNPTTIDEKTLRTICDRTVGMRTYYKGQERCAEITFDNQKVFNLLFRALISDGILDKEIKCKPFSSEESSPKENCSDIDALRNNDTDSLLGILEQERSTLAKNKKELENKKLKAAETETTCSKYLSECCKITNNERIACLEQEKHMRHKLNKRIQKCKIDATHDLNNIRMKSTQFEDTLFETVGTYEDAFESYKKGVRVSFEEAVDFREKRDALTEGMIHDLIELPDYKNSLRMEIDKAYEDRVHVGSIPYITRAEEEDRVRRIDLHIERLQNLLKTVH